jgi:inner membrane protein
MIDELRSMFPSVSMGVKLITVCGMALLMAIPAAFVEGLVNERKERASEVTREISNRAGGEQTFLGPTLAIPYRIPETATQISRSGVYLVFPNRGSATVKTATEERRRSLFKVPVFQADLTFDASFDVPLAPALVPAGAVLDWANAEIVTGVTDPRGALADGLLTVGGKTSTLLPAATAPELVIGGEEQRRTSVRLFGAPVDGASLPGKPLTVKATLRFSGARRIAVIAYGKTTRLAAQGDWADVGFDGGFLPVRHSASGSGYTAERTVPFIARGVRAEGPADSIKGLDATALGISFIELADPYQSVSRSVKYVLLFLGLVFLSYFVFEVTSGKRVHPAQYVLVGVAQLIFYLLLLSLSERTGFDLGFLVAGAATVGLLSTNAGWVFASRAQGMRALVNFTLLYGLIYLLLRLEDNALLVGAMASFLAVAGAMYFTRRIDWYGSVARASERS